MKETATHLFLLCPFARGCWHGSTLAIHFSDYNTIFVQQWLTQLLSRYKHRDPDSMFYLQAIFTTLWTIWNYRNRVVHQGINPNPMDVILTGQNLSCRYKKAFSYHNTHSDISDRSTRTNYQSTAWNWQLIIKVARTRSRKPYRSGR